MTIYNKTTTTKTYGFGDKRITVPASAQDGVRGDAVVLNRKTQIGLSLEWERVLADKNAGLIDIE